MVAGLPTTRTGTPEEAADLAEASARLRPLRDALTSLVQEDSDAYAAVLAAMRLPKATDADKRSRRAAIESAMQGATETPLETMRCCQQALRGAIVVAANGNRNAGTDTAAGVELLLAGLRSAGLNVDINIDSVSDGAFASRVAEDVRSLRQTQTPTHTAHGNSSGSSEIKIACSPFSVLSAQFVFTFGSLSEVFAREPEHEPRTENEET